MLSELDPVGGAAVGELGFLMLSCDRWTANRCAVAALPPRATACASWAVAEGASCCWQPRRTSFARPFPPARRSRFGVLACHPDAVGFRSPVFVVNSHFVEGCSFSLLGDDVFLD